MAGTDYSETRYVSSEGVLSIRFDWGRGKAATMRAVPARPAPGGAGNLRSVLGRIPAFAEGYAPWER